MSEDQQPITPVHAGSTNYLVESNTFRNTMLTRRDEAMTIMRSLDGEIAEHKAEMEARLRRRSDLEAIVSACEAAVTAIDQRPAPETMVLISGPAEQQQDAA